MDILKLRINNLFQKYSVELDLRKKMNILYGANGIGKTTVLRFYQALVNNDFIEILRWDFDSIEVLAYEHGREEGERSFYIERKDLLPADLLLPLFPLPAHQVQDGFRIPDHRPLQTGSSLCLH